MIMTSFFQYLPKVYALLAATLIFPALAQAKDIQSDKWDKAIKWDKDIQWDKWDKDTQWDKGHGWDKGDKGERGDNGYPRVSAVPEANTGWVLVPFMGAVLLFSARHLIRRKATE